MTSFEELVRESALCTLHSAVTRHITRAKLHYHMKDEMQCGFPTFSLPLHIGYVLHAITL